MSRQYKKDNKEFDRSVCFTFFESYLEGADKIADVQGKEFSYDYLTAIIRYALYQEESKDPIINAMVSALKNTIDANQKKRASGFTKENTEQTKAIITYYQEHPEATEREVAEAVGCSNGKVNKVKREYVTSNSNPNPNPNSNCNNNDNSILNNNRMSVSMSNASSETADAEEEIISP